jgi:hypothetical protein
VHGEFLLMPLMAADRALGKRFANGNGSVRFRVKVIPAAWQPITFLFVMLLATGSVHITGVTTTPNGAFMKQVARNLQIHIFLISREDN